MRLLYVATAANSLLAELHATDEVENIVDQNQVKTADGMSLSEAKAAATTLQKSKIQPTASIVNNHESSHEQSVSETQNDSESTATRFKKMTSAEKRKLKSKLRGHVSKRATSKLGSINKWIKVCLKILMMMEIEYYIRLNLFVRVVPIGCCNWKTDTNSTQCRTKESDRIRN